MAINVATPLKGEPTFRETNVGAHYYMFTKPLVTTQYTEVFANIVLPTSFKNFPTVSTQYSRRNAYICMGLTDDSGTQGVDIGLANIGGGWCPYYYDFKSKNGGLFDTYKAGSGATNAEIVVKRVSNTRVGLYVRFTTANGTQVGNVYSNDNLAVQNTNWTRYCRFASMVPFPVGSADRIPDGTYMLGGKFTNLGIYNSNTKSYEAWGKSTSHIRDAWIMSSPYCQVSTSSNSDTFTIDHR